MKKNLVIELKEVEISEMPNKEFKIVVLKKPQKVIKDTDS